MAKGLMASGVKVTVVAAVPHYPEGKIPAKYRWKPMLVETQQGHRVIRTFVPPLPSKGFGMRLILFVSFILTSLLAIPLVGKADAVFASNPQTLVAFPGAIYSKLNRCTLILNIDDLWPESLYDLGMLRSNVGQAIGDSVARVAYSTVDLITPISTGYVETLRGKYQIEASRIDVVPGGVDLDLFNGEIARADSGTFQVLYIGAFSRAYDFDLVLRGALEFTDRPEIKFVFQGAGEMSQHLKSSARRLNLGNVVINDWVISREEAARMMLSSDVLLVPLAGTANVEKGFSSKIYEYQAAGKPIICSSRGIAGEYISRTRSGLVVNPGDIEAFVQAVRFLRENKREADEMGSRGRQVVLTNYSIVAIGVELLSKIVRLGVSGPSANPKQLAELGGAL